MLLQRQLLAARVELHGHRGGRHDDALLEPADPHREISGQVAALRHDDVALLDGTEARELGHDGVGARVDEIEDVAPLSVRDARHRNPGGVIGQRHGDARQRALALIDH